MRSALRFVRVLGPVLLIGLPLGPAQAHDRWPTNGGPYLDIGGGAEFVNLPKVTAYVSGIPGDEFGGIDDEFWTWSAEAALGFVDSEGTVLPDPMGQNARVELRTRYSTGTSDRSQTGDFLHINSPDQSIIFIALAPDMQALSNTMLETWEADLTYQTDVVVSDHVAFSPLVGLTYTRIRFENDFKTVIPGVAFQELNDSTNTDYYGLALGADFTVRPVPAVDLVFGVRGDLMGADASMYSHLDALDESDHDAHFAARGTASLGVGLRFGPLTLRAEGFFRYLSYLATAKNPIDTPRPAEIHGKDMWSTGARGTLALSF
ncbi:MAG TPA: hypothetical protein VJ986_08755 [Gaiellaceae bacterium]|nr:hypothetical protein [Gaiellaceae bacterium]